MSYFSEFPNIFYRNSVAKNISARPFVKSNVLNNASLYYPYEMKEYERADLTSERIYQTPFNDWLIYLSNNISDPYHDWYMSQIDFENFIISKYGSVASAQEQIKFYRVNWLSDDSSKTPAGFQQLSTSLKKYWTPIHDESTGRILKYVRKQLEITQNTNRVCEIDYLPTNNNQFVVGEKVKQGSSTGVVVHVSSSSLSLQHVVGSFSPDQSFTGEISGTVATCVGYQVIQTNISSEEAGYWTAVSYYDFEDEENEKKRTLNLLVPRYSQMATTELQNLLKPQTT